MNPYYLAGLLLAAVAWPAAEQFHLAFVNRRPASVRRAMRREQHLATYSRALVLSLDDAGSTGRHAIAARPDASVVVDAELVDDHHDLSADLPPLTATPPTADEVLETVRALKASMPLGWSSTEERMRDRQRRAELIVGRRALGGAA